jgi:hypothetical protein
MKPSDLEDLTMQDIVIIKNKEILDLVSLFEDTYGTAHSIIEQKIQERGGERLSSEMQFTDDHKEETNLDSEDESSVLSRDDNDSLA